MPLFVLMGSAARQDELRKALEEARRAHRRKLRLGATRRRGSSGISTNPMQPPTANKTGYQIASSICGTACLWMANWPTHRYRVRLRIPRRGVATTHLLTGAGARLPDGDCVNVTGLIAAFVGAAVWRHKGDALTAALIPAATSTPARVARNHVHGEIIAM